LLRSLNCGGDTRKATRRLLEELISDYEAA
jgi:hypothetical protein